MSQRLPALKPKEVTRKPTRAGFVVQHPAGSHYVLKNGEKANLRVAVPWHGKDLKRGTLGLSSRPG